MYPGKITTKLALLGMFLVSGCMSVPDNLNLSLDRATDENRYQVEALSLANPIGINKMHAWEIRVRTPAGEPVSNARIDVSGGMPQHGHGFPTNPRVTRELGEGRYLLEGMKFSMPGWWEIKLAISSALGTDRVTLNKVIGTAIASDKANQPLATASIQ
ncbi:FixH family protein [soil metagenome]